MCDSNKEINIKVEKIFKKMAWIQSHHLHLQLKFKLLAGNSLKVKVMGSNPGWVPFKKILLVFRTYLETIIKALCYIIINTRKRRKSSYILRRPQNFAKSPPIISLAVHRTNNWWRFRKILWPSQNIWTLTPKIPYRQ